MRCVRGYTVGKILSTNKNFEQQYFGYSFAIQLVSSRNKSLDNSFILRNNVSNEEFMGRISIDIDQNDVRITLMPLANPENQKNYEIRQDQMNSEKLKVLMGFYHWLRYPEQTNDTWTGQRKPADPQKERTGDFAPIDVGKEVKESTLPFRRRIIDDVQEAWSKTEDLVNSLDKNYLETAKKNNGTELTLNMHFLTYSDKEIGGRYSDTFTAYLDESRTGFEGNCVYDQAQVESLAQAALRRGEKAVVSVKGCWAVPELEGSPRGVSPRGNTKRLRQKATGAIEDVLFLLVYDKNGKEYDPKLRTRARDLFNRNKKNALNETEKKELNDLLVKLNAKEVAQNLFTVTSNDGMHFANGSYMQGNIWKGGGGADYVIRPKRMEAA